MTENDLKVSKETILFEYRTGQISKEQMEKELGQLYKYYFNEMNPKQNSSKPLTKQPHPER